ncbi:hypothetical protein ACE02Z_17300 [Shewanella xiamenensis]|uniref:hypothetical protein n=1 Tax=Shewanella xiamenensis TaxID=332186 RepID=UPI001C4DFC9C|nr:hypothetical protein [Shewanella xiamenensis]
MAVEELKTNGMMAQVDLTLFAVTLSEEFHLKVNISPYIILFGVVSLITFIAYKHFWGGGLNFRSFEINEAEIGLGNQKLKLKPNLVDKQIAYKIWVELSTRKIGLPIDLEHDVITEIYDSWYTFFAVTRELIKEVPVAMYRREDTAKIIGLSIDILNVGIRPHLTTWQAKYRRWYDSQLIDDQNKNLSPQDIQTKYLQYEILKEDLMRVNDSLIKYRQVMQRLISNG